MQIAAVHGTGGRAKSHYAVAPLEGADKAGKAPDFGALFINSYRWYASSSGLCPSPSEVFVLELYEVEGPEERFVVGLQLLDHFFVVLPQPFQSVCFPREATFAVWCPAERPARDPCAVGQSLSAVRVSAAARVVSRSSRSCILFRLRERVAGADGRAHGAHLGVIDEFLPGAAIDRAGKLGKTGAGPSTDKSCSGQRPARLLHARASWRV